MSENISFNTEVIEPPKVSIPPIYHMGKMRAHRNKLLSASDWTQASDSPLPDAKKAEWALYRQQLRDIISGGLLLPDSDSWPTPPSA
jgi:hypothetical protein